MRHLRILALAVLLIACTGNGGTTVTHDPTTTIPTATVTTTLLPPATRTPSATPTITLTPRPTLTPTSTPTPHPLSIPFMRLQTYPSSNIVIEETLEAGSNYDRFIVSYQSEGLKIYGLLTVPKGEPPATGWPVIVFDHGYIKPELYEPTERYEKYVDALAQQGYIVFRPDYRGHGNSEGKATGGFSSPAYTIDVLNAVSSIQRYPLADPDRVGMWGHSMGGQITLRAMVATCCAIRAGVIWSGVVAPYDNILTQWHTTPTPASVTPVATSWRQGFVDTFGDAATNPAFWAEISPNSYLADISGALQLHHATGDQVVPVNFSRLLYSEMLEAGRTVFYFEYDGNDHNISENFGLAMERTIAFFDEYVKNR